MAPPGWYRVETNDSSIMLFTPSCSLEILVFWHQLSYDRSQWNTSCEGFKWVCAGPKRRKTETTDVFVATSRKWLEWDHGENLRRWGLKRPPEILPLDLFVMTSTTTTITSCAARWPPQYAPAPPRDWLLTFWPWSRCDRVGVACAKMLRIDAFVDDDDSFCFTSLLISVMMSDSSHCQSRNQPTVQIWWCRFNRFTRMRDYIHLHHIHYTLSRRYRVNVRWCICYPEIQIYTNIFKFQTGVLCYNKEI